MKYISFSSGGLNILVNPPNGKLETHTSELSVDAVSFGLSVQYSVWHKMPVGIVFHDWQEKMNPHAHQIPYSRQHKPLLDCNRPPKVLS